jgi:hypothetical protein
LSTEIRLLQCVEVLNLDDGTEKVTFFLMPGAYGAAVDLRMIVPKGKYKHGDQVRMTLEPQSSHTLEP